jgi:hypothetical protein
MVDITEIGEIELINAKEEVMMQVKPKTDF